MILNELILLPPDITVPGLVVAVVAAVALWVRYGGNDDNGDYTLM